MATQHLCIDDTEPPLVVQASHAALLVTTPGAEQPERHILQFGGNTIGRSREDNTLVLPFPALSKKHASIEVEHDGQMFLCDLGSTNKTRLIRAHKKIVLKPLVKYEVIPGDAILFGDIHCVIDSGDSVATESVFKVSLSPKKPTPAKTTSPPATSDMKHHNEQLQHAPPTILQEEASNSVPTQQYESEVAGVDNAHGAPTQTNPTEEHSEASATQTYDRETDAAPEAVAFADHELSSATTQHYEADAGPVVVCSAGEHHDDQPPCHSATRGYADGGGNGGLPIQRLEMEACEPLGATLEYVEEQQREAAAAPTQTYTTGDDEEERKDEAAKVETPTQTYTAGGDGEVTTEESKKVEIPTQTYTTGGDEDEMEQETKKAEASTQSYTTSGDEKEPKEETKNVEIPTQSYTTGDDEEETKKLLTPTQTYTISDDNEETKEETKNIEAPTQTYATGNDEEETKEEIHKVETPTQTYTVGGDEEAMMSKSEGQKDESVTAKAAEQHGQGDTHNSPTTEHATLCYMEEDETTTPRYANAESTQQYSKPASETVSAVRPVGDADSDASTSDSESASQPMEADHTVASSPQLASVTGPISCPAPAARAKRKRLADKELLPRPTKRGKKEWILSPIANPIIISTGINEAFVKQLIPKIQALGGTVTSDPKSCTHMCSDKVHRTIKFLGALNVCQYIVSPKWVKACIKAKCWLDEQPYLLSDPASEAEHKVSIRQSLEKAKNRKLLQGVKFYITPKTKPDLNNLKLIIECAGGEVVPSPTPGCLVLSCTEDKREYARLIQQVRGGYKIYASELVLSGVLRQELDWHANSIT